MKPLSTADEKTLKKITAVCLDIDDTLSTDGKLTREAYESLWMLKDAGFMVIPVTGRPAGWCDHIVRFWPVDGVVGENGAFVFFMKNGKRVRHDLLPPDEVHQVKLKLLKLREELLSEFPEIEFASDQAYREYDLAIDIKEDVPAWSDERVQELLSFCKSKGAQAKLSSIHVNVWFGQYTKQDAVGGLMEEAFLPFPVPPKEEWIYIGDSPNDEPAFQFFDQSVGVANLLDFGDVLKHRPTWITDHRSGSGFREFALRLIAAKN